jgi:S1-C subfamily serine protease
MRMVRRTGALTAFVAAAVLASGATAQAQAPSFNELVSAVVRIKTHINPDARTIENLGRDREGSGIVIDQSGLILTIGYLMVEAYAAEIVTQDGRTVPANILGYDHESGFGLLRTVEPFKLKPLALGKSADVKMGEQVLIIGGGAQVSPVRIASKREFAGAWEYLLEEAIFTSPPHAAWSGTALVNREGKLIGVGSLIVPDAGNGAPGNMFVPIDRLAPVLGDMLSDTRSEKARPWLGLNTNEIAGRLLVTKVTPQGPAEKAGVARGDIIIGIAGERAGNLADFYRKLWAQGSAGAMIPLDVERGGADKRIEVPSIDRLDHLKLKSTF